MHRVGKRALHARTTWLGTGRASRAAWLVGAVVLGTPWAAAAEGLVGPRGASGFVHDVGGDFRRLPTRDTALWLGIGSAVSLAVHPQDSEVVERVASSDDAEDFLDAGQWIGSEAYLAPATLLVYGVGRWTDAPRVSRVASGLLRVQLLSQVMTHGIKLAAGRTRPDGGKYSFPSGHASAAFGIATYLQ